MLKWSHIFKHIHTNDGRAEMNSFMGKIIKIHADTKNETQKKNNRAIQER